MRFPAILLCSGLFLAACSGEPTEEELLALPALVAEHLRAGEVEEALEFVDKNCDLGGMTPAQVALWLPRYRDTRIEQPFVAHVERLSEEDDQEARILVLGLFRRASEGGKGRLRPFSVLATARILDGEWRFVRIEYDE